jgi:hypothetical protein
LDTVSLTFLRALNLKRRFKGKEKKDKLRIQSICNYFIETAAIKYSFMKEKHFLEIFITRVKKVI